MKITLPQIFTNKRNIDVKTGVESRSLLGGLSLSFGTVKSSISTAQQMQLSAVYRAVECITDSVAALPFETYKSKPDGSKEVDFLHSSYGLLNKQPNKIMSRFTFIKLLLTNMLLKGNGYAQIIRDDNGNATELRILNPDEVTVYLNADNYEIYYKYRNKTIYAEDMIHVLNFSYDGIIGISTLTHAATATSTAISADQQAKGFFAGGANLSGILKVNSKLDDGQAAEIQTAWRKTLSSDNGTPNGIVVIEGDLDFQPVSISPHDAQMLESRQFSVLEIARFFGVPPIKLFDTSTAHYNNIEESQLAFLTDTLSPIIEKVENEFNRKLFRPSEKMHTVQFNVAQLLRADMITQAEYMSKLFQVGGFTINEIRNKIGMPLHQNENTDKSFVQSSMLPMDFDFRRKDNIDNKYKGETKLSE